MRRIVSQNNSRGVTLVEVMIALVVLLIVFVGLIQTSLLSIDHNVRNEVRDEAVRVASETMADVREHFSDLKDTGTACENLILTPAPGLPPYSQTVTRTIRKQKVTFYRCGIVHDVDAVGAPIPKPAFTKQVTVTLTWYYQGVLQPAHSIVSIVRD